MQSLSRTALLWTLLLLFALRVAGQAIQKWLPQPYLPAFGEFQGSGIPYSALLAIQLVILAVMVRACWGVHSGTLTPNHRTGGILRVFGSIYMAGSLARIAIGTLMPDPPSWFTAWIPAFFHVVLSAFVLVLAHYHLHGSQQKKQQRQGLMRSALAYVWYPTVLTAAIAAFGTLLSGGASLLVATYFPITLAGLMIVVLERFLPERSDWKPTRSDVLADIAFLALVQIILARLFAFLATITLASWAHTHSKSSLWPHDWPLPLQILCMVLAVDFMRYWLHRACHTYSVLWRLHEVHHSPDILYTLNVARFHPLEKALHFLLDSVPFMFLGVAPEIFAGYFLLYSVNGFFQHSNLRLRYGWLNYVVGSAETHRWHHARDPKTAWCNFSNTTIIWDLVFGTWHLPKDRTVEIGIPDRSYPKGFFAQMLSPFRKRNET